MSAKELKKRVDSDSEGDESDRESIDSAEPEKNE